MFDKLVQVLRVGYSYQAIADSTCSATTLRARRNEWIKLGAFIAVAIQRSGDVIAALEARTDIPAQDESR